MNDPVTMQLQQGVQRLTDTPHFAAGPGGPDSETAAASFEAARL